MNVKRDDADELLDIKYGKWTLEEVQREAEHLFAVAHETKEKSTLPDEPDRAKIEALCVDTLGDFFR